MSRRFTDERTDRDTLTKERVKEPRQFKVLLHNDDFTTMEFVIQVLMLVFKKSETQATRIMLMVHNQGVGVCGVYTSEVAETKVAMVRSLAKSAGFPLLCTMEEV